MWQLGLSGKLPFTPSQIGNWWNANEEIDLVVLGEKNAILVECKWSSKPVGSDILAELERKAGLIRAELEDREIGYGLCSRSGFTAQLVEDVGERRDVRLWGVNTVVGR